MPIQRALAPPLLALCLAVPAARGAEPEYLGAAACAGCHAAEHERWRGSHHDRAMQVADDSTVLGDFGDVTQTHFGVASRFFRRDGRHYVRTEGSDGEPADFRVAYTFGVEPLQQYLVEFPDGRVQTLPWAWDTRPGASGGQRWLHVYPDEALPAGDALHWTGPNQNWNHMCADCHSTNLRKRYQPQDDRFRTTWSQIDVSCEACHGPGSSHAAWAALPEAERPAGGTGLVLRFEPVAQARWETDPETGLPRRVPRSDDRLEVETCGRCHSRRSSLREGATPGKPLLDSHRVALLEEPLYFADGQIRDEVYVYGSFLQSRMHAAGVRCSDCHEPHAGTLRAEGNALCSRCHEPARFDVPAHHHHPPDSQGARCVECHMPARTYMQIDPRRDHRLGVPRPDLSLQLGTPNACTGCHGDRDDAWAAAATAGWRDGRALPRHWAQERHAARRGDPESAARLLERVASAETPAIVRATLLGVLPEVAGRRALPRIEAALRDADALVRTAALATLEGADPGLRLQLAGPLLRDPVRSVRLEATRLLASVPPARIPPPLEGPLREGLREFRAVQALDADRPDAHLRLGTLALQRGDPKTAEAEFLRARELAPWLVPAAVNLADLYRAMGADDRGEAVLREALARAPDDADLHHALGLLLVRQKQLDAALPALERAATLRPESARYSFVLAVALHESGQRERARAVLRAAAERHPTDREIASFLRQLEAGG